MLKIKNIARKRRLIVECALLVAVGVVFGASMLNHPEQTHALGQSVQIVQPTSSQTLTAANPVVSGTGPAGTYIHLTIDNTLVQTPVQVDGNGNWAYTATGLSNGAHSVTASELDGTAFIGDLHGVNSFSTMDLNNFAVTGHANGTGELVSPVFDSAHHQIFINDPFTLTVHVFDTQTKAYKTNIHYDRAVRAATTTRGHDLLLDASRNKLYIPVAGGVQIVDTATNTITQTVSDGNSQYNDAHQIVQVPGSTTQAYLIPTSNVSTLDILDETTNAISHTGFSLGSYVSRYELSPDGSKLFYQLGDDLDTLHIVDLHSFTELTTINQGVNQLYAFVVSPDSSKLYISDSGATVHVYNTTGFSQTTTIAHAGGALSMVINSAGTRLYAGNAVTNLTNNTVIINGANFNTFYYTDTANNYVIGTSGGTTMRMYDPSTGALLKTFTGLRGGSATDIVFDSANNTAYSINSPDQSITEINLSAQTTGSSYDSGPGPTGSLLASKDGSKIYSSAVDGGVVQVFNAATKALITSIHLPGTANAFMPARGMFMNNSGSAIYVAVRDGATATGSIVKIDTSTNTITATYNLPAPFAGSALSFAVNEAENAVYIAADSGGIKEVSLANGTLLHTITSPQLPTFAGRMMLSSDGSHLYTISLTLDGADDTFFDISTTSHTIVQSLDIAQEAEDFDLSPDGSHAYIVTENTSNQTNYVQSVLLSNMTVEKTVSVSMGITASIDVAPNGWLFVANRSGATIFEPNSLGIIFQSDLTTNPDQLGNFSDTYSMAVSPTSYSTASVSFTENAPLNITTTTLPKATLNQSYAATIATGHSHGTVSFSVASGSLPAGITLNPTTGALSGTVSNSASTQTFTVQANDGSTTASQQLTISVLSPKPAADMLGQLNGSDQPLWTQSAFFNNQGGPNSRGFGLPVSSIIDTVHHRLYVGECNYRISEFDLTSSNQLIDHVADHVLGQATLADQAIGATAANSIYCAYSMTIDTARNRLFVSDAVIPRVLVFDTATLTDNMNASYVLGQSTFTSTSTTADAQTITGASGLAYDNSTGYLYAGDTASNRVMVFNTATLSNGMAASFVLGQSTFAGTGSGASQTALSGPSALSVDPGHRLFVADATNCRVLVFDTTTLSNGKPASYVLGKPSFTSTGCTGTDSASLKTPAGLIYDGTSRQLFVSDSTNNRLLGFDTTSLSNGAAAVSVLGQGDFNEQTAATSQTSLSLPFGLGLDGTRRLLYANDAGNNRLMIWNLSPGINQTALSAATVGTAYNQQISASPSFGTNRYSLGTDSLPAGLSLSSSGVITGSPTVAGSYSFVINVQNVWETSGSLTTPVTFTMTVNAAPATPPAAPGNAVATQPATPPQPPASPSPSVQVDPTPTPPPAAPINLDTDETFASPEGTTVDAQPSQVMTFALDDPTSDSTADSSSSPAPEQTHTITVDEVGDDYANVTVRSKPINLHLIVGQIANVDVDYNATNDLSIKLVSVVNRTAKFTIQKLVATTANTTAGKTTKTQTSATATPATHAQRLPLIIGALTALVIVVSLLVLRQRKNKARRDTYGQGPTTPQ